MTTLDEQQQAAVDTEADRVLVVAVAGSGKTRVLTKRIEWLLHRMTSNRIIAITFTNAAAKEIEKRIGGIILGHCGTLHSLMLRILQKYGYLVGFKQNAIAVMDEAQREVLLISIIQDLKLKLKTPTAIEESLPVVFAAISGAVKLNRPCPGEIGALEYYTRLRNENIIDFDSILQFGLWAMNEAVRQGKWNEPFEALLVDEFQDSNPVDALIYEAMPVKRRFFVGDDAQAIYGFRGSDVAVMLREVINSKLLMLENNYRSDEVICKLASRLVVQMGSRIPKVLRAVSVRAGEIDREAFDAPSDEVSFIARDIKANVQMWAETDCAVLLRTNSLARFFADELERYNVKVTRRSQLNLPPDWARCRMFLNLLVNPENDTLAHWWLKESRGTHEANKIKLSALGALTTINQYLLKIPKNLLTAEVPILLAKAGIQPESLDRVQKAMTLLREGDGLSELSLKLGAEELHRTASDTKGVTVCTVHAAKGLEWPCVFIPCLNSTVWPPGKSEELHDERRLLYVGVTRAMHRLVLTHSRHAFDWNMKLMQCGPSVFWKDLA